MRAQLTILLIIGSLLCQAHAGVKEALAAKDRGDYETARKEFQALAEKGEAKAMIELGLMYHTGEGVKQDYGKAMEWYLKAFDKGNGDAYSNIGVMYRDGLGCETNRPIAYALFYITHMRGLGSEDTQYRAGHNLDKTAALMKPPEIEDTLKMTEEYVLTFVRKRGNLDEKDKALKFSKEHRTLKKLAEL
jgi:TPR repeat protein